MRSLIEIKTVALILGSIATAGPASAKGAGVTKVVGPALSIAAQLFLMPAMQPDAQVEPAPSSQINGLATCGDFLGANRQGQGQPYVDYVNSVIEQLDSARVARGCRSAIGFNLESNQASSLLRMCQVDPAETTLYSIANYEYGLSRAASEVGGASDCGS